MERWDVWTAPKDEQGKLDHHKAITSDDLRDFVYQKLYPYLQKCKMESNSADTIEYKIGEMLSELKNKILSGYHVREDTLFLNEDPNPQDKVRMEEEVVEAQKANIKMYLIKTSEL